MACRTSCHFPALPQPALPNFILQPYLCSFLFAPTPPCSAQEAPLRVAHPLHPALFSYPVQASLEEHYREPPKSLSDAAGRAWAPIRQSTLDFEARRLKAEHVPRITLQVGRRPGYRGVKHCGGGGACSGAVAPACSCLGRVHTPHAVSSTPLSAWASTITMHPAVVIFSLIVNTGRQPEG